jgi:outer membrane protein assembly factor BamB
MVDNEQALMDLVAPYNVVLWLQGHGHSDIQWSINGVPAIMQKGLYQGSYTMIDVSAGKMTLRRRALVDPKKRKSNELVRDKSGPAGEEVEWEDLMTISLQSQPSPRWAARAEVAEKSIRVTAHRGDLPDDATVQTRVDGGEFVPMVARGDEWSAEVPVASLIPGNHIVTVQATLRDGGAYQKPVSVRLVGAVVPAWETIIGGAVQSRLVRAGDLLYLPSMGGDLVALRAADGAEAFRVKTDGPVYATPHVENGVVYFTSTDHHVYAADANTGDVKWKTKTGGAVLGGATVAQGIVCAGSVDTKIYGLDAKTGVIRWTVDGNNMYQSKPATDGVHFFVGGWDNRFRCIDAATGKEKWVLKLGKSARNDTFSAFSPAIASPAIGDGLVYISTNDGILHALRIEDGSEAWRIDWQKMGYSSPLFHDGRIYCALSDEGKVFCADAKTGAILWIAETGSVIYDSSFCFGNGNVFVGCVDGTFNAIRAADGKVLWQYRLGPGHVLASPVADEEHVYISSMSGKVTALPTNQ